MSTPIELRKRAIENMNLNGLSEYHLVDTHYRIAEIVAKAYAKSLKEHVICQSREFHTAVIIEALTFDGENVSTILNDGIRNLVEIDEAARSDALNKIKELLISFADYATTHPAEYQMNLWRNTVTDIGVEIGLLEDAILNGKTVTNTCLKRLTEIFTHLWN